MRVAHSGVHFGRGARELVQGVRVAHSGVHFGRGARELFQRRERYSTGSGKPGCETGGCPRPKSSVNYFVIPIASFETRLAPTVRHGRPRTRSIERDHVTGEQGVKVAMQRLHMPPGTCPVTHTPHHQSVQGRRTDAWVRQPVHCPST